MEVTCHCRNVIIEAEKPAKLTQCNCSICSRYMSLWAYYLPGEPEIKIGDYGTSSYSWGDNELDFIRCSNCGCVTHYQTKAAQADPRVAINFGLARHLVSDIPIRHFDGANKL